MSEGNNTTAPQAPITPAPTRGAELAIEGNGLGYKYSRQWAVRNLDIRVPRGSVYGFLGLNGAGKSTTIRMMLGLLQPDEGYLTVAGADPATADIEVKRRVGYVPDTPAFYDWMTVEETCALVAHYRGRRWNMALQQQLLSDLELDPAAVTSTLSKGQKARLSLVLALGFDPDILILDEPTLGLDAIARRQFAEGVLREYAGEGKTVFISSHLINEISGIVDYVGILKEGNLIIEEPAEELRNRFQRVELQFDGEAPASYAGPRPVRRYRADGRSALIIDETGHHWTPADFAAAGASTGQASHISLEEIFVEIVGKAGDLS